MTVENTDNTYRIFSDYIDEFVDAFPTPGFTLTLSWNNNCGTLNVVEINPVDISSELRTEGFPVPTTVYFYELELAVGVYDLKLTKTDGTTISTEFLCVANVDELECEVVEAFAGGNTEVWLLYEALVAVADCDACVCSELCPIFNRLTQILNGQITC